MDTEIHFFLLFCSWIIVNKKWELHMVEVFFCGRLCKTNFRLGFVSKNGFSNRICILFLFIIFFRNPNILTNPSPRSDFSLRWLAPYATLQKFSGRTFKFTKKWASLHTYFYEFSEMFRQQTFTYSKLTVEIQKNLWNMVKVNNRPRRTKSLTFFFIVNFKYISLFLASLFLILSRQMSAWLKHIYQL